MDARPQARQAGRWAAATTRRSPNYAARRMLVSAGAITVVIAAIAFVWGLFGDDDAPAVTSPIGWDAVAVVARATGDVTLVSREGTIVGEYERLGRTTAVEAAGSHLALIGSTQVTLLDGAGSEPVVVPLERGSTVTRLVTDPEHLLLAASPVTGGEITVIDGITGWTGELGELAGLRNPRLFTDTIRTDPTGRTIAVADAASFQTVVVHRPEPGASGGDGDEPVVENYAAQPLAIDDAVVATSQVIGQRADISVYAGDDLPNTPVSAGVPAGGVIADGALVAVTNDGSVIRIRRGDRSPRTLATLALPDGSSVTGVHPVLGGTRLAVLADGYTALIDLDGVVLYEAEHPSGITPVPKRGWACLPVGLGIGGHPELVSAADGSVLDSLTAFSVASSSADGCTVAGSVAGAYRVRAPGEVATLESAGTVQLSPDGRAVITATDDRRTYLTLLDESLQPGEPIELTVLAVSPATSFVFVSR